jgi:TatD DNase family protein
MVPQLFDTHCHLNFSAYKNDLEEVVRRTSDENIACIVIGSQIDTSRRAVEIAEKYGDNIRAIVGLHPIHLTAQEVDEEEAKFVTRAEVFDPAAYKELANHASVAGIGECGLDYFRLPEGRENEIKQLQQATFEKQIELAASLDKVLMVHSRDAYDDIYAILKNSAGNLRGVVIHSFIGNLQEAEKFLELGCFIGLNGIITYKPRKEKLPGGSDPQLLDAIREIPLDRIVLETDAPYLSPEPLRGQRNEPARVKFVAEKLALIKRLPFEQVATTTTDTAHKLFGI